MDNNTYKFWVHDPPKGEHRGHPRVLVAFRHNDDGTVTYAATTWSPKEALKYPFDRQQATKRAEGRLACPRRSRTIKVGPSGPRMSIVIDILERDDANGRTDTARYQACQAAFEQKLWQADISKENAPVATAADLV